MEWASPSHSHSFYHVRSQNSAFSDAPRGWSTSLHVSYFWDHNLSLASAGHEILTQTPNPSALCLKLPKSLPQNLNSEELFNMDIGTARCCLDKHVSWLLRNSRTLGWENIQKLPHNVAAWNLRMGYQRLAYSHQPSIGKNPMTHMIRRTYSMLVSLEESSALSSEDYSSNDDSTKSPEEALTQPLSSDELKSLLADSERARLIKKLSEANQQNRFLKRQLHIKEDALVNFKRELAVMELEIQALVILAEEITKSVIPEGSRKINGKYIQSHLLSRLKAVHGKLKEQIKDVDNVQSKEVPIFWSGMAESVQVMGTFDGWSQGEQLSPEYTSSFTKFSTTLMLRPGRYEIKFMVDGEWQLSPEYPSVGEGLLENNLLIVE